MSSRFLSFHFVSFHFLLFPLISILKLKTLNENDTIFKKNMYTSHCVFDMKRVRTSPNQRAPHFNSGKNLHVQNFVKKHFNLFALGSKSVSHSNSSFPFICFHSLSFPFSTTFKKEFAARSWILGFKQRLFLTTSFCKSFCPILGSI